MRADLLEKWKGRRKKAEKVSCEVVRDLLPLYVGKLLSDQSRQLVEGHLAECASCRGEWKQVRLNHVDVPVEAPAEEDAEEEAAEEVVPPVDKKRERRIIAIAAGSFLALTAMIVLWGALVSEEGQMGYDLMAFYLLLPAGAFAAAWAIGMRALPVKWAAPAVFGLADFAAYAAVHRTTDGAAAFAALAASLAGCLIGAGLRASRSLREE